MKKLFITLSALLVPALAYGWVIKESKENEDVKIIVNDGGTPKEALTVEGATGTTILNGSLNLNLTETTTPTNGLRRSAANTVALSTNSTDRLTISTSLMTSSLPLNITGAGASGGNVVHACIRRVSAGVALQDQQISCLAGERLTGGGCSNTADSPILHSYPLDDDTWVCRSGSSPFPANHRAYAICCRY